MPGATGVVIAAPSSGSGKTTITLGLLRYFARERVPVSSFKIGPDYIDPGFHAAASGRPCLNIDSWAMRSETIASLFGRSGSDTDIVIGEGVMGLFDGAQPPLGASSGTPAGTASGSTADTAALLGLPVILVVDVGAQAQSAAATVHGFATFRADVTVSGVVFNRVGSDRHAKMLREAAAPLGIPVLGCVPRRPGIAVPDRHLGLVQASEMAALEIFLDAAADLVSEHLDIDGLKAILRIIEHSGDAAASPPIPPMGQRISVAADDAFRFAYPHVLAGWRGSGAEISTFSPLANEAPASDADAVYLPGGYPELQAEKLAANATFLRGLRDAAARGAALYGECGGYMVLGETLSDAAGTSHAMAGLLPLETSFAQRRVHLGYRNAVLAADSPFGAAGTIYGAHEFHYASTVRLGEADPLFTVSDAAGTDIGPVGACLGKVSGSFIHLIDRR